MKTKKLCVLALLSAVALSIWAAEGLIPPIVPLPGIRLGLANILLLLGTPGIWWYLPALMLSGILTGLFTGFCARFALPLLRKALRLSGGNP